MPSEPAATPKRPKLLRRLLALVLGLVFAFVCLEVLLRLADPLRTGETIERETFIEKVLVRKPDGDITMAPTDSGTPEPTLFGQPVRIRENGFRDDPVEIPKPEDRYRILILGDSVAFGWGVREQDAFPQVLEAELEARGWPGDGRQVEVFCAAAPGWGLPHYLKFAIDHCATLEPDAVVVTLIDNDLTDILEADGVIPPPSGGGRPPGPAFVRDLFVTRALHRLWSSATGADERPAYGALIDQNQSEDYLIAAGFDPKDTDPSVDKVTAALAQLRTICAPARFVVADTLGTPQGQRLPRLIDGLEKASVERIDCFIDVKRFGLSPADRHPNADGHAVLAEKIEAWLVSR